MDTSEHARPVTRRVALGRLTAAGAALALPCRGTCGEPGPGASPVAGAPVAAGGGRVEQLANGVEIWQVTSEARDQSNIYCEVPFCSRDSRWFVYYRSGAAQKENPLELMVVELGTWKQHLLDVTRSVGGMAITHDGVLYYVKRSERTLDLMRADLASGAKQCVYQRAIGAWIRSMGTVSVDGRYYAAGIVLDPQMTNFGILLVDLQKGQETVLDRDPFILNPHPQFEPGESKCLMIQHNRGGKFGTDGKLERLVGPEGATLYLLSVSEGKRTELQVGKPFTTPITGHEAWIGRTQEMLLTVSASGDCAVEKGNLVAVRVGAPARIVSRGYRFNHLGVSRCGRFFCCDDWRPPYRIVIGSIATGKSAVVCESKTVPSRSQSSHPHAYLTPDLRWVIFNSTRIGATHIYAASVPEGMIAELLPKA